MEAARNPSEEPARDHGWPWLAFLLNLTLAPAGYVYAGFPLVALVTAVGLIAAVLAIAAWTIAAPPGIYALAGWSASSMPLQLAVACLGLTACLGVQAAWLCRRPRRWSASPLWLGLAVAATWPTLMVVVVMIRPFAPVAVYQVSSASMEPMLSRGDFLLAWGERASCGGLSVRPGDVVIYRRGGMRFLGRAIGAGGTALRLIDGVPIINGQPLVQRRVVARGGPNAADDLTSEIREEILPGASPYRIAMAAERQPQDTTTQFRVPAGHWFILGDERDDSRDSRFTGAVADRDICGVAQKVLWSQVSARIGTRP